MKKHLYVYRHQINTTPLSFLLKSQLLNIEIFDDLIPENQKPKAKTKHCFVTHLY